MLVTGEKTMKTKAYRFPAFIAALLITVLACQTLTNAPTATATAFPTGTNTSEPTATNTLTEPPTATVTLTATAIPDPGLAEVRKIDEGIMDGGPVEFLGLWFDENSHDANGTTKYTEGYNELLVIKHDGKFTFWFGETYLSYTMPEDSRYLVYTYNSTVDVNISESVGQLMYILDTNEDELKDIMPNGYTIIFSRQGFEGEGTAASEAITVTIDHDHNVEAPLAYYPARSFAELKTGEKITFDGGAIRSFTCKGDVVKTVVVLWGEYTAECDEVDADMQNVYYTTDDKPREGTEKENARLLKYFLSRMDEFADGSNAEYYWYGDTILGDALPFSLFGDTHQVAPLATSTPLATLTRTPRPTPTPTINMTITGTVTPSTSTKSCSNDDQDVTYVVTGPMIGNLSCAENMTKQELPVKTLQIPGPNGMLYITLDRVGGTGAMYAAVITSIPGTYGTPTFTLTGKSIAKGHAEISATDDALEAVMDGEVVTMTLTVGEFTVTAEAWLK